MKIFRLLRTNPSLYTAARGYPLAEGEVQQRHPVEMVRWCQSVCVLRRGCVGL